MNRKIFKTVAIIAIALLSVVGKPVMAQVPANCGDVMLQAFDYYPQPINLPGFPQLSVNDSKWTTLNSQVVEIGQSFQMIWLPPSGYAGGAVGSTNMGYLPQYWFTQNSAFGLQADLKTLIANLKTNNCKAIADIVVNHRNGITDWCNFATESYNGVTYTPNSSWICTDDESRAKAPAGCNNPQGAADTGEKYDAARDLDHTNSQVRDAIKGYLSFMKNEMGYSGWRYDVAAGFSASYVGEYDDAAGGYFSVGEVLKCDYTAVETWINGTGKKSTAFDFPFQCSVRDAFNGGDLTKLVWKFLGTTNQPAGLIHNPDLRRYATTFIENHDTYRYGLAYTGNIPAGNAFMLGSPGVPTVYLPHWIAYKSDIKKMIAARKKAGLHSQSAVVVLRTESNIYVGEATGTNGKLIVKVGSGSYSAPTGYTLECSGTDWAIWTNSTTPTGPTASISPAGGYYASGTNVTLSSTGGTAPVKIYYTTNGSTPTSSSTLYTEPFKVTDATVKAIAIDNSSIASPIVSETYTTILPSDIDVHFKVPSNWSTVKVWAWKGTTNFTGGVWPGTALTITDGYVVFSTPATNSGFSIVFNNGDNKEQTVNITNVTGTVCYQTTTSTGTSPKKYNVEVITGCSTGIDTEKQASAAISIYPNPAKESVTIESDNNISEVRIYSIYGTLVKSVYVNSNSQTIELSGLPAGYYSVVVISENGDQTNTKLIKR